MKKLFATLLAATMVAGTAVSAFAYIPVNMADKAASNDSYTLVKNGAAHKDNGEPYGRRVEGGDKIYYPILVAGDEIDDKKLKAEDYYYATKASEVEDLKVTLKDVRGGKYIKGAKIVRQDLNIGKITGEKAELKLVAKTPGEVVKDPEIEGYVVTVTKPGAKATEAIYKIKVTAEATAEGIVKIDDKDYTVDGDTIKTIEGQVAAIVQQGDTDNYKVTQENKDTIVLTAIAPGKKDAAPTVVIAADGFAVKDGKAEETTKGENAVTAEYKAIATKDGKVEAAPEDKEDKFVVTIEKAGIDAKSSEGKVYCVEVELGDYFGTQETEVEFDLTLRTRSKQYETKDDGYAPRTSFDLGKDAVEAPELKDGARLFENGNDYTSVKFRNNELTLGINKYTRSVKLDEAKKANNDVEDIERIFLEGDDFNFEVKASDQDELYLEYNQDANKKVIIANPDAKMDFFNFPGKPEFDFTGLAQFDVEDPDKSYYFYEIVDDKPVKTTAKYNKEDECFELRTRTLGSYVISDKELKAAENPADKDADKPATDKPTTETPVNPTTPGKNVPTGAIA